MTADKGVDRDLAPLVANALGLAPEGQSWTSRSLSWKENEGPIHSFYISRGPDQDIVFALSNPGKIVYGYRAHRDGSAVAAFSYDPQTKQVAIISTADAQKPLDGQIAFWTGVVANPTTASNN